MNKKIVAKMLFSESVEHTSVDVNSNKFLIYYRKNGELNRFELPLNLINDVIYIDENDLDKCPICKSTNLIYDKTNDTNDPLADWECLACGANKNMLDIIKLEIDPKFKSTNLNNDCGFGNLSQLKIQGERYLNGLHWYRYPIRLQKLLKKYNVFKINPLYKSNENERFLVLKYFWYLNEQYDQMEEVRVCDYRYLKPPKEFNRVYLKYKYPDIWNVIDAKYKWEVKNDVIIFQLEWDIQKYNQNLKG